MMDNAYTLWLDTLTENVRSGTITQVQADEMIRLLNESNESIDGWDTDRAYTESVVNHPYS